MQGGFAVFLNIADLLSLVGLSAASGNERKEGRDDGL